MPETTQRPNWVTFVLDRSDPDFDLIVEPWEGSPPYGWMSGRRYKDDASQDDIRQRMQGTTDYFGHSYTFASDRIEEFADLPGEIEIEIDWGDDRPAEVRKASLEGALPFDYEIVNEDEDECEDEDDEEWKDGGEK